MEERRERGLTSNRVLPRTMQASPKMNKLWLACLIFSAATYSSNAQTTRSVCGLAAFAMTAYTSTGIYCVCPVGTGKINAVTTATAVTKVGAGTLTYTASGYLLGAQTVITLVATGATATAPEIAALCTDILPGYALAASGSTATTLPAVCPDDYFCPGKAAAVVGATDTTLVTIVAQTTPATIADWITAEGAGNLIPIACPATGTGTTASSVINTDLSDCLVSNGYYVSTAATVGAAWYTGGPGTVTGTAPAVTQCPIGKVCVNGANYHLLSTVQTPTTCVGAASIICLAGTCSTNLNSHSGTSLVIADAVNEVACKANSVPSSDGTTCVAAAGYFGANDASSAQSGVALTACPAFSTTSGGTTTGATTFAGCTDLLAGYAFVAGIAQPATLDPAENQNCPAGTYCPGLANVFIASPSVTGLNPTVPGNMVIASATALTGTYTVVSTATTILPYTCPTGSTTAAAFSTSLAACSQLAAGYYMASGTAAGGAPVTCPAGFYCAGSAFEVPAIVNGVLYAAATASFGATACPAGSTSAAGSTAQSACTALAPGYYE